MSQPYTYTDPAGDRFILDPPIDGDDEICVGINPHGTLRTHHVHLPASERPAAAQALAGDGWRVVPVDEWKAFKPPLMSQYCRDGKHGYDCTNCECLCHTPNRPEPPPDELLYDAWSVIANVSGGDWRQQSGEWREAAGRWRDRYHDTLGDTAPDPAEQEIQALYRLLREETGSYSPKEARALHSRGVRVTGEQR